MDTARTGLFGVSPIHMSVGLACALLLGAVGWNIYQEKNPGAAAGTASDTSTQISERLGILPITEEGAASLAPMTPLGANILANAILEYENAMKDGADTEIGLAAVKKFGESVLPTVEYKRYASSEILTDEKNSPERVLQYRADLRVALEPLLENKEYELDIFAMYIDTKDEKYLTELRIAARNYEKAIISAENVVAPSDAALYHASILSAMSEFSATLEAMADNATDPFASTALLKTFTSAQDNMLTSFNAIGSYAAKKIL